MTQHPDSACAVESYMASIVYLVVEMANRRSPQVEVVEQGLRELLPLFSELGLPMVFQLPVRPTDLSFRPITAEEVEMVTEFIARYRDHAKLYDVSPCLQPQVSEEAEFPWLAPNIRVKMTQPDLPVLITRLKLSPY